MTAMLGANGSHLTSRSHSRSKGDDKDFPGGTMDKNLPAKAGDTGSIPGPGRLHMPLGN